MTKKRQNRLKLALRYISHHPDLSARMFEDEWKLPPEKAIDLYCEIVTNINCLCELYSTAKAIESERVWYNKLIQNKSKSKRNL